jgi:hypothetical protein
VNTEEIMRLSLKLASLKEVLEDSAIYASGDNIRKILRTGLFANLRKKSVSVSKIGIVTRG